MNPLKQNMKKGTMSYVENKYPHHEYPDYPWNYVSTIRLFANQQSNDLSFNQFECSEF